MCIGQLRPEFFLKKGFFSALLASIDHFTQIQKQLCRMLQMQKHTCMVFNLFAALLCHQQPLCSEEELPCWKCKEIKRSGLHCCSVKYLGLKYFILQQLMQLSRLLCKSASNIFPPQKAYFKFNLAGIYLSTL